MAADVAVKGDSSAVVKANIFLGADDAISLSPFSSKLLMYLRLAGIPHTVHEADIEKAPKSKVPYIIHGKNIVGDSQLIIRYLENTYNVKKLAVKAALKYKLPNCFVPFEQLSITQKSTSESVRSICENDLYWAVASLRWAGSTGLGRNEQYWTTTVQKYFMAIPYVIRGPLVRFIRGSVLRDAWGQGFCRHSAADQLYLAMRGLSALSGLLGSLPFFCGESPSECDCIAFGTVEQILQDTTWPSELASFLRKDCPNLVIYRDRIRGGIFADVKHGQTMPEGIDA